MKECIVMLAAGLVAAPAFGALVDTRTDVDLAGATVDGTLSSNEYGAANAYAYSGGGSGFGGPLGSGTLYMQSDATNLYIGLQIQGALGSNIINVYLDTRSGGFTDDTSMTDTADGGRAVASKLTRDVQDNLPVAVDFALQFGSTFTNLFELTTGSHNFIAPGAAGTGGNGAAGFREASIPLATLGLTPGSSVDFLALLVSDTSFSSNEGVPSMGDVNNPGFDNSGNGGGAVTWSNFNRFNLIPEPASVALCGMGLLLIAGRRRSA